MGFQLHTYLELGEDPKSFTLNVDRVANELKRLRINVVVAITSDLSDEYEVERRTLDGEGVLIRAQTHHTTVREVTVRDI